MDDNYIFSLEFKVRDYEVDCEGIVNNANYLHYLEYTRHEFCSAAGYSFKRMQEEGIDPVLNRVEIDYKTPLRSEDIVVSKLWVEMKGVRFIFHQDVFNKLTGAPAVSAIVSCVCLINGRISRGEVLYKAFKKYIK